MSFSQLPRKLSNMSLDSECTKFARFSAVAAAILTAPPQNRAIFKAPRCAISSAKKIASERRFSVRLKGTDLIPTAEFPAIPESAAKIASERRCAILVHSVWNSLSPFLWSVCLIGSYFDISHFRRSTESMFFHNALLQTGQHGKGTLNARCCPRNFLSVSLKHQMLGWQLCRTKLPRKAWNSQTRSGTRSSKNATKRAPQV